MNLSSPSAVSSLAATAVATSPSVSWKERIGQSSFTINLDAATGAFEIAGTFKKAGTILTLDTEDGSYTLTNEEAVAAAQTLTLAGNAVADQTVTIGTTVYTWKAAVTTGAFQVKIGATASDSLDNLIAAINLDAGSGTLYGSATTAHPDVTAAAGSGDTMVITAAVAGAAGNAIATTETMTAGSWGAATMAGGYDATTIAAPAAGGDIEGIALAIPDQLAIEIRCTSGSLTVESAACALGISAPGVILVASGVATTGLDYAALAITAGADNTAFTITALGK